MILNLHSLAFGTETSTGGGNPAWGTEMGQGDGYRFSFENSEELITAMVYRSVPDPQKTIYCPLGKGGNQSGDYEFVLGSLFEKVFVNGIPVNGKFLLLIVKKLVGANHVGRRTLKYNPRMTLDGRNYNEICYKTMASALGVSEEGSWFVSEINVKNQDELHFTAHVLNSNTHTIFTDSSDRSKKLQSKLLAYARQYNNKKLETFAKNAVFEGPLQQIFFGAPGTGKSHSIKGISKEYEHFRITFHPDTDYASFVGAYKPTTTEIVLRDMSGHPIIENGVRLTEEKIAYKFVQQAFLKAYVAAWREQEKEEPQPVFLVIEEINRGNCAQIFGDIFQLLDRNEEGFSDYPIHADTDLSKELGKALADLTVANADGINALYDGKDIVGEIKKGTRLLLPNNLYIWATMNTSDQSLFPIDSAFKRRWDWKYIKIADSGKGYVISVNDKEYDWWKFLQKINEHIGTTTSQEDKKLGYFFAKATKNDDGKYVISADKFLSKVLFFLYGDVYKDYGFDDDIFKGEEGTPMEFSDYFDESGKAIEEKIEKFLLNLGLEPKSTENEITEIEDAEILESEDADNKISGRLTVEFPDGTTVKEGHQFDTYLKALQKIGLAKALQIAAQRQYVRKDEPLISKIQSQRIIDDPKYSYVQSGDYYIIKGIDLPTQINFLKLLSQKLNLGLSVYAE